MQPKQQPHWHLTYLLIYMEFALFHTVAMATANYENKINNVQQHKIQQQRCAASQLNLSALVCHSHSGNLPLPAGSKVQVLRLQRPPRLAPLFRSSRAFRMSQWVCLSVLRFSEWMKFVCAWMKKNASVISVKATDEAGKASQSEKKKMKIKIATTSAVAAANKTKRSSSKINSNAKKCGVNDLQQQKQSEKLTTAKQRCLSFHCSRRRPANSFAVSIIW